MDIHKPKPWHGVREFLKEYVIIVVGVLTALGAEQTAEWLHWRHVTEIAEHSLRADVSENLDHARGWLSTWPCETARTVELAQALNASDGPWRGTHVEIPSTTAVKPVLPQVEREGKRAYARAGWETAVAEGVVPHLPEAEAQLYARVYRNAVRIEELQAIEADLEPRLSPLAYDRAFSREQRDGFVTILSHLDSTRAHLATANRRLLDDAARLKAPPPPGVFEAYLARMRAERGFCVRDIPYPVK
jgi:hypothetical protein